MKVLDIIAMVFVLLGALNWGLVGVFNWNLVAWIFGAMSLVAKIVYIVVGASAIYGAIRFFDMD